MLKKGKKKIVKKITAIMALYGKDKHTCVLHFVPNVPLSNNGFSKKIHLISTYRLASTLSKALTTISMLEKNFLPKSSNV